MSLLGHHQPQKLVLIHPPFPRRVKLLHHRHNIRIRDIVPHLLADLAQIVLGDHALAIGIKQAKRAAQLLARVAGADERTRDGLRRGQVELAVDGRALLVVRPVGRLLPVPDQQVVRLRLGQLEAQRPEYESEFLVREKAVLVGVEKVELGGGVSANQSR